jgi:hypothetical protein
MRRDFSSIPIVKLAFVHMFPKIADQPFSGNLKIAPVDGISRDVVSLFKRPIALEPFFSCLDHT